MAQNRVCDINRIYKGETKMKEDLIKLSDEQVISLYKKGVAEFNKWAGCHDGSEGLVYHYEIEPYEKEWVRRGYKLEDLRQ